MRSLRNKARVRVTDGALSGLMMTLSEVRERFQGTVVTGKFASQNISAVADLTFENAPPIREIPEICIGFLSAFERQLVGLQKSGHTTVLTLCREDVWLEQEVKTQIIHNCDHGDQVFSFPGDALKR